MDDLVTTEWLARNLGSPDLAIDDSPARVASTQPAPPPLDPAVTLRQLHQKAARTYADMDSYIMRMRRREVVGGKNGVDEIILAKFRKEPFSVNLKWLGDEGKGREVIFVKGKHDNHIHTLMAPGDFFLFGGKFSGIGQARLQRCHPGPH